MKKFLLIVLLCVVQSSFASNSSFSDIRYAPGKVLIKLKTVQNNINSIQSSDAVLSELGLNDYEPLFKTSSFKSNTKKIYKAKVPQVVDIPALCKQLSQHPQVEYAQPDYLLQITAVPNDPQYANQHFLPQISAPQAWDKTKGSSDVIIAVIDTGVDYNHVDLADNIWENENEVLDGIDNDNNGYVDDIRGWDWVDVPANAATQPTADEDGTDPDNDPMDVQGHGTAVSGSASAVTNNSTGVAGIGWNCQIMSLRIGFKVYIEGVGVTGNMYSSWGAEAIQYAVEHGAKVINLSWGAYGIDDLVTADAIEYAYENDVLVCLAAGNDNASGGFLPHTLPQVLSVGSVDRNDRKASYSNYGDWVKITAPGGSGGTGGILTTNRNNGYGYSMGTSLASPVAAGVAGLVRSVHPDWSVGKVLMHMVDTADEINDLNPTYMDQLGWVGRVNAAAAVTESFSSKPDISVSRYNINDSAGNNDGFISPGETANVSVILENSWADAENVSLTLDTDDPAVTILNDKATISKIYGMELYGFNRANNDNNPFTIKIADDTFPKSINFKLFIETADGYKDTTSFRLGVDSKVLFVDDDDNSNNIEHFYYDALDTLGVPYDVWNRTTQGRLLNAMQKYPIVIWACEWSFPSLDEDDRYDLTQYLQGGGNLFMSGQDIGWDLADPLTGRTDGVVNENYRSDGKSNIFYEGYLHASYVSDQAQFSLVEGVDDHPISKGMKFPVYQPGREINQQFPSVIEPVFGGQTLFAYPDGSTGAVVYEGDYKVVYFAFGGFEAIAHPEKQPIIMNRIYEFFTQLSVNIVSINGVEENITDYDINVSVETEKVVDSVNLYWRFAADSEYTKTHMAASDSLYTAVIPRQENGTEIEYFVLAKTTDGYYSTAMKHLLKVQNEPPTISAVTQNSYQLNNTAKYVEFSATDQSGVNAETATVTYWIGDSDKNSLVLDEVKAGQYSGWINDRFSFGDTLFYQFSIRDLSAAEINGQSEIYFTIIGMEDFENGLGEWETDGESWGLDDLRPLNGSYALHESPGAGVTYQNNADISIATKTPLDLSGSNSIDLTFQHFYAFTPGDSGLVQVSTDSGDTWITVFSATGAKAVYGLETISLAEFDAQELYLRFRVVSDNLVAGPGWFIDDIKIQPNTGSGVESKDDKIVTEFYLTQNYPNPFNSTTVIQYGLAENSFVDLGIYNLLGQKVKTLVNGNQPAGAYMSSWNGLNESGNLVPSGIYFYKLQYGNNSIVKKLAIVK